MSLGKFWLLQMGKFWKISLAIWSHCLPHSQGCHNVPYDRLMTPLFLHHSPHSTALTLSPTEMKPTELYPTLSLSLSLSLNETQTITHWAPLYQSIAREEIKTPYMLHVYDCIYVPLCMGAYTPVCMNVFYIHFTRIKLYQGTRTNYFNPLAIYSMRDNFRTMILLKQWQA